MTQHELLQGVRVVAPYDLDTLGAPFKVTLHGGVTKGRDAETGKEMVQIADHIGLIGAVVRARVMHQRKLSGEELAFVRKALCVRAKNLAEALDMSAEHLSRCEAGTRALSPASEKMFRMFAFIATFYRDAEELLAKLDDAEPKDKEDPKYSKLADRLIKRFMGMKFQILFDPLDELHFEFVHRSHRAGTDATDAGNDGGEWSDEPPVPKAA